MLDVRPLSDGFHHPEDPNILILSNVKVNGEPTGLQDAGSYFPPTTPILRSRPHPITGRTALYVCRAVFGIVGLPDDEARDLLDELAAHATPPKYRLRSSTASATW